MLNMEMKLAQPWKLRKKREASVFSPASTYTLCIFISGTVLGFGHTDTNQKIEPPPLKSSQACREDQSVGQNKMLVTAI